MATVTGTALDDTITPTFVSDGVTGMPTAGDDVISGLAGDDLLDGGAGDDTLNGGPGNDILFGQAGHNVFEFATGSGIDIVADMGDAAVTDRNDLNFADIAFDNVDAFGYRTGDSLGILYLPTGDAISVLDFYVGGGDWRIISSDAIEVGPDTDDLSVTTGDGSDGIPDYQQLFNLTIGSPSADTIVLPTTTYIETAYGNLGDDHLTGSEWVSLLVGGGGADHLFSGAGDLAGTYMAGGADADTYHLAANHSIAVNDTAGSAGDVLVAASLQTSTVLAATVAGQHLVVGDPSGSTGCMIYFWQAMANRIESIQFGNATWSYDQYSAALVGIPNFTWEELGVDGYLLEEGLRVIAALEGGPEGPALPLTVGGTSGNDTLNPLPGDNTMFGGAGDDVISGGAGDDWLDGAGGKDLLHGGGGDDTLSGGGDDDTLLGLAGKDVLDGEAGADTMKGGPGDDTYVVDDPGDVIHESRDYGTDLVLSEIDYSLKVNVENLTLSGADPIDGTGNQLANIILGNAAANVLHGKGGDDTLFGGDGVDELFGDDGNDTLDGGGGADTLKGGLGDDRLAGGAGGDILWGGDGNDVLDYDAVGDSKPGARDGIRGFTGVGVAGGDVIDLSDIDAVAGGDDDAFAFIGTAGFSAAGQLRVRAQDQNTVVEADVDGDAVADLVILVNDGAATPGDWTPSDFIL